ncbi:helix-turn-helix transcriptional regulator [Actinomadura sp. DC4]|uniref:helix-turn-helix domain-containing protein n=1 Tax=Actinomadura sp. DC4 TaxID=3055069 RepID=UPI0025AF2799|nr:helix-turn-helix transcriptional regulator [Actinomadura sp. DC4]MDN3355306.1 helix-turn-helix transcriptional regulator [Actinomadura sp. DC4]
MPRPGSATVRNRRLAAELRRLRESGDFTGDDVAERLGWSASKVSRLENARQAPRFADVRRLLDLYGVEGGYREQLLQLARDAVRRGWWEAFSDALPEPYASYIGLEIEAEELWQWETQVIPGLLQTEAYAQAVEQGSHSTEVIPPSRVDARVEARLERQSVLTREHPLRLSAVLDEALLLRRFGDAAVMAGQLRHLQKLAELPNVTLQVLPLEGPHPIATGSFTLLQFPLVGGMKFHDVVYIEHLNGCSYLEEETETYRHRLSFERLRAEALGPAESLEQISRTAREKWIDK